MVEWLVLCGVASGPLGNGFFDKGRTALPQAQLDVRARRRTDVHAAAAVLSGIDLAKLFFL